MQPKLVFLILFLTHGKKFLFQSNKSVITNWFLDLLVESLYAARYSQYEDHPNSRLSHHPKLPLSQHHERYKSRLSSDSLNSRKQNQNPLVDVSKRITDSFTGNGDIKSLRRHNVDDSDKSTSDETAKDDCLPHRKTEMDKSYRRGVFDSSYSFKDDIIEKIVDLVGYKNSRKIEKLYNGVVDNIDGMKNDIGKKMHDFVGPKTLHKSEKLISELDDGIRGLKDYVGNKMNEFVGSGSLRKNQQVISKLFNDVAGFKDYVVKQFKKGDLPFSKQIREFIEIIHELTGRRSLKKIKQILDEILSGVDSAMESLDGVDHAERRFTDHENCDGDCNEDAYEENEDADEYDDDESEE